MNLRLGLAEPSSTVVAFALIKLFALGFALAWLHGLARAKYGKDTKAALSAGFFVGLLIWGWALAGLLLAGYVNMAIALPTFLWGMVELPVVALAAARVSSRFVGGA